MYLADAVGKHERLRAVPCLHEQACTIAAEAHARIKQNIGVALVTTGPGATNAITGVAGAWIESIPLLVISGQVKRSDMLRGAPLRQKGVQEVDIVPMVRGITKYAKTVERAQDIRIELERAVRCAKEGRAGPVWIDIPLDVQGASINPDTLGGIGAGQDPVERLSPGTIESILSLLASSSRPLILAGHGVRLAGAAQPFRELAEAIGVPVATTWNAMDLLPHDHPLCVGRPGVVALRAPNFAVQNCDLLIAVGSRLDNIITAYNPKGFARAAKKVVVDVDAHELENSKIDIAVPVQADARHFVEALLASSKRYPVPDFGEWRRRCGDWKKRYPVNDGKPFPTRGPISHYHFVDALSKAVPSDTLISTGSSGLAVEVFYSVFRNKPGQRIFLTSGLGAMGYGLPAAIGACFANDKKPMVALESDGSLQFNIQELATLRGSDLPVCLVVMNNGGYASIRNTQRTYFEGRYVGTGPEGGLWLPDLERVAAAYELPFMRIDDAAKLEASLEAAMAASRPLLLDVRLVENEALFPKSAAIPQADGSMMSMPLEDMSPLLSLETLRSEMLIPLLPASERVQR